MKTTYLLYLLFAAAITATPLSSFAGSDHHSHSHGGHEAMRQAQMQSNAVDGTVKKVDKANGKITLSHGELPNGMPPMTMQLKVNNPSQLNNLKDGQAVRFVTETKGGSMSLISIEPR